MSWPSFQVLTPALSEHSKEHVRISNHHILWGMCSIVTLWIGFVIYFYGPILLSPNTHLFAPGADGLKSLYTLGYQIKWGQNPFEFYGMHYPFGDVINFSVSHPGLSILLGHSDPVSENYAAIVHIMILAGLILTPVLMARNYLLAGVPVWMAIVASSGLFLLNPQILRLESHIDLAHMWVMPLGLYLMFKSWKSYLMWPAAVFVVFAVLIFFTHPYPGLMICGFWAAFFFLNTIMFREKRLYNLTLFLTGLIPVLFYILINALLDNREGRSLPGGFWEMTADLSSVLFPTFPPLWPGLMPDPSSKALPHWETWSYVGLSAQIIVLIALIWLVVISLTGKAKSLGKDFIQENAFAILAFLACLPLLWFAMGMPILINRQTGLSGAFEFLFQFRAPGRFTWVFWHSFTFLSVSIAGFFIRKARGRKGIYFLTISAFFALLLTFNGVEGIRQNLQVSRHMGKPESINPLSAAFQIAGEKQAIAAIKTHDFEAIVTMPYFHIGSENFGKDTDSLLKILAFRISLQTGLPLCTSQMSRTSYPETLQQVALWYEALEEPVILEHFNSKKKILVLAKPEICNPAERQIIDLSDKFSSCGDMILYSLPVDRMVGRYRMHQESLRQMAQSATQAGMVETFDGPDFKVCGTRDKWDVVCDIKTDSLSMDSTYVCSFWVKGINRERIIRQLFKIGLLDEPGWQLVFEGPICHHIVGIKEDNALVEYSFQAPFRPDSLRLEVLNTELPDNLIHIDNLLVRNDSKAVAFEKDGIYYLNNRPCQRPN